MKKYNRPTLNIEDIEISTIISTSTIVNFGNLINAGDKGVDFSDFGSGEWN